MTKQRRTGLQLATAGLLALACLAGCQERPGWVGNQDPALRRKDTEFVKDAMPRFPFKPDLPKGQAVTRAEVDYMYKWVGVANLSDESWKDAEVWVNRQYVVFVPRWTKSDLKRLDFSMLRDERGNPFQTNGLRTPVKQVEVVTAGKVYDVPVVLAD
jgi:hypothetical protein